VEVKPVAIRQREETYILCRTAGRQEKEKAIRSDFHSHGGGFARLQKTIATARLKSSQDGAAAGKIQAELPVNICSKSLWDTPRAYVSREDEKERKAWREYERRLILRTNLQAVFGRAAVVKYSN